MVKAANCGPFKKTHQNPQMFLGKTSLIHWFSGVYTQGGYLSKVFDSKESFLPLFSWQTWSYGSILVQRHLTFTFTEARMLHEDLTFFWSFFWMKSLLTVCRYSQFLPMIVEVSEKKVCVFKRNWWSVDEWKFLIFATFFTIQKVRCVWFCSHVICGWRTPLRI